MHGLSVKLFVGFAIRSRELFYCGDNSEPYSLSIQISLIEEGISSQRSSVYAVLSAVVLQEKISASKDV